MLSIPRVVLELEPYESGVFEAILDTRSFQDFKGILVGAFQVEELLSEEKEKPGIDHHFIFELGLVLTEDPKNIEKTSQSYELTALEILDDQMLSITLENQEALLARDLKIEAMLYDKKNCLIKHQVWNNFQFAPQSTWTGELDLKSSFYLAKIIFSPCALTMTGKEKRKSQSMKRFAKKRI